MRKFGFFIMALVLGLNGCSGNTPETQENIPPGVFSSVSQPIINGKVDYMGIWSSVAAIILKNHPSYPWQVACTGTLISPRYVLTAAHCVADLGSKYLLYSEDSADPECRWSGGYISTGASDIVPYLKVGVSSMPTFFLRSQVYDIRRIIYHSGFSTLSTSVACVNNNFSGYEVTQNDIALLELSEPVPSDVANPMPILPPWLGITEEQVRDGLSLEFLGYGYNEKGEKGVRRKVDIPLEMYCADNNVKFCPYDKTVHVKGCHPDKETCEANGKLDYYDDMVAVPSKGLFYLQSDGGACNGDSGGPAIVKVGGRRYVAGVTSYGDNACSTYGISTAVQDFYDWIVKNAPEAAEQVYEICGNGLDDDNNGLYDFMDDVCEGVPYCGDGKINQGSEACDLGVYRDGLQQCSDWSEAYSEGKVFCNEDCSLDFSMCVEKEAPNTCANGQLDEGEQCDGTLFHDIYGEPMEGNKCADFSAYFTSGDIKCNSNCTVDLDTCTLTDFIEEEQVCGDGVLQRGEFCDGNTFMGGLSNECTDWDPKYLSGKVSCFNCKLDFEGCIRKSVCGDGKRTEMEVCEGNDFYSGKQCDNWSIQMAWGEVSCNSNCTIDYSKCTMTQEARALCGNGVLDAHYFDDGEFMMGEECDGDLFVNGDDCFDWDSRFVSGKVTCMENCMVNLEKCKYAMDVLYLDENARGKLYVLNRLPKPEVLAPQKPSDSIEILPDGNLSEDLASIYLQKGNESKPSGESGTSEKPGTDPEEPPGDSAEEPSIEASGCSTVVSSPSSGFPLFAMVGIVLGAGCAIKRRKKYRH